MQKKEVTHLYLYSLYSNDLRDYELTVVYHEATFQKAHSAMSQQLCGMYDMDTRIPCIVRFLMELKNPLSCLIELTYCEGIY